MNRRRNLPTESELRILEVLWSQGPSTVREVHRVLSEAREIGHTTVLKLMQIMAEKGSVIVDRTTRPQIFRAAAPMGQTQSQLVTDLLDRAFAGASGPLVLQALSAKRASAEERAKIREMLDRMEEEDSE